MGAITPAILRAAAVHVAGPLNTRFACIAVRRAYANAYGLRPDEVPGFVEEQISAALIADGLCASGSWWPIGHQNYGVVRPTREHRAKWLEREADRLEAVLRRLAPAFALLNGSHL